LPDWETALNPDDSRLAEPANVTPGPDGSLNPWTAPSTAVNPSGGTAAKDGAAWFEISTLYTIASPTLNPSAAFSVLGRPGIEIAGQGSGPLWSFADTPPFNSPR
jgi:hypothetical protein